MWRQLGERRNVSTCGIDIKLLNPYPVVFSMDVGTISMWEIASTNSHVDMC